MANQTSAEPSEAKNQDGSKDFVEHLRTVHFTLLAVCLGAIVVVLTPSKANINTANEELDGLLAARHAWRSEWLMNAASSVAQNHDECSSQESNQLVQLGKQVFWIGIARKWDVVIDVPGAEPFYDSSFLPQLPAPNTLNEFRENWEYAGLLVCPKGGLKLRAGNGVLAYSWKTHQLFPVPTQSVRLVPPSSGNYPFKSFMLVATEKFGEAGKSLAPSLALVETSLKKGDEFSWVILLDSRSVGFPLSLKGQLKSYLLDVNIAERFDSAYAVLDGVVAGMDGLSLDHVKEILHAQEGAAKEDFEAFGIKFPLDSARRWAILIITSIQLYFWLHLGEYRRRGLNDSVSPWIGLYPSLVARSTFCATAFIAPATVVAFLNFHHLVGREEPMDQMLLPIAVGLSILLSCVAMYTYLRVIGFLRIPTLSTVRKGEAMAEAATTSAGSPPVHGSDNESSR